MHKIVAQKAVRVKGLAEEITELASQQLINRALKNDMLLIFNDISACWAEAISLLQLKKFLALSQLAKLT